MRLFLDSSALAKRYVFESGSERVAQLCESSSDIVLSVVTSVELASALNRRKRERLLSAGQYREIKRKLAEDLKGATIVGVFPLLIAKSIICLERCELRALDALQIASAIVARTDLFATSDKRQLKAANRMGLKAELV